MTTAIMDRRSFLKSMLGALGVCVVVPEIAIPKPIAKDSGWFELARMSGPQQVNCINVYQCDMLTRPCAVKLMCGDTVLWMGYLVSGYSLKWVPGAPGCSLIVPSGQAVRLITDSRDVDGVLVGDGVVCVRDRVIPLRA